MTSMERIRINQWVNLLDDRREFEMTLPFSSV